MAAKLPGKFDDISKTASSVLGDDFQKGFQLKTKQTTRNIDSWHQGAHCEFVTDLFPATGDCKTPTKLSFKFPKPFTMLEGIAVEKIDLEKDGKKKVEIAVGKELHGVAGLKLEVKSDLAQDLTYCSTYTAIKDVTVKFETKHFAPQDFTAEILNVQGPLAIGAKFNGMANLCPSVGVNFVTGDLFASLIAKNTFSEFTGHAHYKVSNDIKVAATYQHGGKNNGTYAVASTVPIGFDVTAKAKFDSTNTLSFAFKRALAKGTTAFGGLTYGLNDGKIGYGAKLSVE